uniref:Glycine zipper 2TM domain-containing protein n=1 Tax=Panagrolaimus sp. PS1159 TaxID=55785 RepID=A0AC35FFV7_9BILA
METKTYLICSVLLFLFISAMASNEEDLVPKYHGIRAERGAIKNAVKGALVGAGAGAVVKAATGHGGAKEGAVAGAIANSAKHAMSGKHH